MSNPVDWGSIYGESDSNPEGDASQLLPIDQTMGFNSAGKTPIA
jgi:hypothetical protein